MTSTQPCIRPGSLNQVPEKAGMSPLRVAGNTVWSHMTCEFRSGEARCMLLYQVTYTVFPSMR